LLWHNICIPLFIFESSTIYESWWILLPSHENKIPKHHHNIIMLSSAKRYGNSSLVHAASSAITAAAMIAIISNDKKKEDIIRSQSRSRLSQKMNTNTTYCSCEGMSTYSRRNNTLRRLGKTSSRVTLESRYKVSRQLSSYQCSYESFVYTISLTHENIFCKSLYKCHMHTTYAYCIQ